MKRDFNIKYQPDIESGRYKVFTKSGLSVDIVGFEFNRGAYPILAIVHGDPEDYTSWYNYKGEYDYDGELYNPERSLVVVTDEPELTEMQLAVYELLKSHGADYSDDLKSIKDIVDLLLPLAKKELLSRGYEILSEGERKERKKIVYEPFKAAREIGYANGVKDGRIEALQSIPKWRKWGDGACGNGQGIPLAIVKRGLNGYELVDALGISGEQYIMLSDLEKLPKE